MSESIGIGVIGLGVMGQRMLTRLAAYDGLRVCAAWDARTGALAETRARYPRLAVCESAAEVIAAPDVRCIYIATPPVVHLVLANQAFDAGHAVLCEKPLTVDFAEGRRTIARIDAEGRLAAVNFSLASSPGLGAIRSALADGSIGTPRHVEIDAAFQRWPREWQAAAGHWLGERIEGGFTREVLSHFVFVLQRALGPAEILASRVDFPADGRSAETAIEAQLRAGGIEVRVTGRVGGEQPDVNRLTLAGTDGTIELHDWFGLRVRRGTEPWVPVRDPQQNRAIGQVAQLDQWRAMLEGREHALPSFAEALAVQQTIEAMLAGR